MSYLIELRTGTGTPGYVIADGNNRDEALANVQQQFDATGEEERVVVLAVHTVH